MAKRTKSISYKGATLSLKDRTITEFTKDETRVYSLDKLLSDWDEVEGISLSIRLDEDAAQDGEGE